MVRKPISFFVCLAAASCQDDGVSTPAPPRFTETQWETLAALADLGDPPPDPSNKVRDLPAAIELGHKLYFDPQFSGTSTLKDTLGRSFDPSEGLAPAGEDVGISCNSCHDVTAHAGSDPSGRATSIGVGAYDVNAQPTINSAYYDLVYWNGRNDSLWAQIVAVGESAVSMGGNRLKTAWRIADGYRDAYSAVFGADHPLPAELDTVSEQKARLDADGTCVLDGSLVCPGRCHEVVNLDTLEVACVPRFPLHGRPGREIGCQWNDAIDPVEPLKDAFDCMIAEDQTAVTRIYVNFSKAIAAYETALVSRDAPFDAFVGEGPDSDAVSDEAKRGAELFIGAAWCVQCHATPLFSDNRFHDVGVPQIGEFVPRISECTDGSTCDCVGDAANCLPWGLRDGLGKLQGNKFRRDSVWSDDPTAVNGTLHDWYGEPLTEAQKGRWRTPSLRNVALTAPYMHNGMYATLEEVVRHYLDGADPKFDAEIVGEVDERVANAVLSDEDVAALVAFMGALTGQDPPADLITAPVLPAATPF
jgi:cytochrome c peroxidase